MLIVQSIELEDFVALEVVSLGEILTLLSTIILLIITWKSVVNANQANEITKESQKLQKEQFELSIKPDLTFDIPPIEFTEDYYDKENFSRIIKPDFLYYIKNLSSNIAYDVNITTFIYLPDDEWNKFYSFLENDLGNKKGRPNIVSHRSIYSLSNHERLEATIPSYYLKFNILAYAGSIDSPEVYVYITYKDKNYKLYKEYFSLNERGTTIARATRPNDIKINFYPSNIEEKRFKEKLLKQKEKLECDFPDQGKLFYYNLK